MNNPEQVIGISTSNFTNTLPIWAIRNPDPTCLEIGGNLPTRDGRRTGNAYIINIIEGASYDKSPLHIVLTDAGNTLKLTKGEVEELFWPSTWISTVREIMAKFGPRKSTPDAYLVPSILSFKGSARTSCPKDLQASIEGTVMWSAEICCDSDGVVDKHGVTHLPKPLFTNHQD